MVSSNQSVLLGEYDEMLLSFKELSSKLSTDEMNAIYYLLRKNTVLTESIDLRNNEINGNYGNYNVDLDKCTIIDEGILITQETTDNLGSITLSDRIFKFSTYQLILTVKHYSDWNTGVDDYKDNIETSTIVIDLENDGETIIPFHRLNLNYIVDFNAEIRVTHDIVEVLGEYGIELTSEKPEIIYEQESELIATLKMKSGASYPLENVEIRFYELDNVTNINLESENDSVQIDEEIQLNAQLLDESGNPVKIKNKTISIYEETG